MTSPRAGNPTKLRILARGATLACGACGKRRLFRRWVLMVLDCPRCELHFERQEGQFVGAVGINTILTFGLIVLAQVAFFIALYPDIDVGPWVFGAGAVAGVIPVLLYPVSKTLWTSIDLIMRPLEEGEALASDEWKRR